MEQVRHVSSPPKEARRTTCVTCRVYERLVKQVRPPSPNALARPSDALWHHEEIGEPPAHCWTHCEALFARFSRVPVVRVLFAATASSALSWTAVFMPLVSETPFHEPNTNPAVVVSSEDHDGWMENWLPIFREGDMFRESGCMHITC